MLYSKHFCIYFTAILAIGTLLSCSRSEEIDPNTVLVSIPPYKYFVEKIAGDTVQVKAIVPAGASPHSYEPTTRQVLDSAKAKAWFLMGETFEERAIQALTSYGSDMKTVDLRKGIDLIEEGHGACSHAHAHTHECADPHIWLSPRLVKKQAETIADTLSEIYPEHAETYHKNLRKFQRELDDLDFEISSILHSMKNRTILVSHPAFAYYCRDYGLKQISIEFEGREPSPQQLTRILNVARQNESPYVYVQEQHLGKGARLVADEIGATIVELDTLSENYKENLLEITKSFAKQ